jgi:hypothetical protein
VKARELTQELLALAGGRLVDMPRASRAAVCLAAWAQASNDAGHFATGEEYSAFYGVDERTAWRHRRAARRLFGPERDAEAEAEFRRYVAAVGAALAEQSPSSINELRVDELRVATS